MVSFLVAVLTYFVAREVVQSWRDLVVLSSMTAAIIVTVNLIGLEETVQIDPSTIRLRPTFFDSLTVLISALLMLVTRHRLLFR
jgi:hypothetical protein